MTAQTMPLDAITGGSLRIVNPATGETIAEVDRDRPEAIREKVARARRAQRAWARRGLDDRAEALRAFRRLLVARKEEIARTLTSEMGKPITQSRAEVDGCLPRIDFFLQRTGALLEPRDVHQETGLTERVTWEPLGVVANISAWNYPLYVGLNVISPALLTGNAVLYKPSETATLTGRLMADLLHEAGVPDDVLVPVLGGAEAGADLLRQPMNAVCFTGSHDTGLMVARAALTHPAPPRLTLELGGKDPVYVCEDVDVANAAAGLADGAFYNAGQSCCAVERIYVHERIHDAFLEAFVDTVNGFPIGDPMDERTYLGPIARAAQIPLLEHQMRDALSKGAKVQLGGGRIARPGSWWAPTVLTEVNHTMSLMREETFGPLIGIQRVRDDEEALRLMQDTNYGLTAGVYIRDRDRAERLLRQVDAGTAYWNCCDRVSPRLPWSGRGQSGVGSTLGDVGIHAFVQPKAWHLRSA